ncbi:hypothetical protein DFH09DRAFT_1306056 [Mycena vulgaris]|nr:hypothetical protein DFH09DRAFT_1306056 [Mycena vulgaris]
MPSRWTTISWTTYLVTQAFHRVYQTHPKASRSSITRAVAYKMVGPALPQALRVVRYLYNHDAPEENDPAEELEDDVVEKINRQRTAVLHQYSTTELLKLLFVFKFLHGAFCSARAGAFLLEEASHSGILVSTGPSGAVKAWENRSYDVLEEDIGSEMFENEVDNSLFSGYLSIPLETLWMALTLRDTRGVTLHTEANKCPTDSAILYFVQR